MSWSNSPATTPQSPLSYHSTDDRRMPSIEKLDEIVGLCRKLLFPGYFGLSGMNGLTIGYHPRALPPNGYTSCSQTRYSRYSTSTPDSPTQRRQPPCVPKPKNTPPDLSRPCPSCAAC